MHFNLQIECPYTQTQKKYQASSKAGGPSKVWRVHSISDTTFQVMHKDSVIKGFEPNALPSEHTN